MKLSSLLAGSVLLAGCAEQQAPQQAMAPPALPVEAVRTGTETTYQDYPASIEGVVNVEIRPQVTGMLERILVDIANAQGGMERLKNTPLPNQYRFFPAFFTRLFCILLPIGLVETLGFATPIGSTIAGLMFLAILQIGDDLVDPFANTIHDVPLTAMCRTIEIDLLQAIGDEAPEPKTPVQGILW